MANGIRSLAVLGLASAAALACAAAPASASMITVETAFDDFDVDPNCSLREAVEAANRNGADANPGCADGEAALDTIVFSGQPFAQVSIPEGLSPDDNQTGDLDVPGGGAGGPLRIQGPGLPFQIYDPDNDTVVLGVQGTGVLTIADLEVNGSTLPSTNLGATIGNSGDLTLEDVKVSGGTGGAGAGISNFAAGDLTLNSSEVSGNTANGVSGGGLVGGGGGIYFHIGSTGSLALTDSVVSDNHAIENMGSGGGGIWFNSSGPLTITDSVITDNDTAGSGGGGIRAEAFVAGGQNATITRSTISLNETTDSTGAAGAGGGIHYTGGAGKKLRVIDSTISENESAGLGVLTGGAGVWTFGATAIVNSTLHDNFNPGGTGGGITAAGGAGGPVSVISSTLADNAAPSGSGIYAHNGTVTLRNSILASGPALSTCVENAGMGIIATAGGNVDEGTSCDLNPAMGDVENTPAGLGPLASNGGPTQTRALLPGSPAIDLVSMVCTDDLAAPLTTDQRGPGFARSVGPCDAGAYEVQPPPPPLAPTASPVGSIPIGGVPIPAAKKCKKKKRKRSAASAKKKRCKTKRKR